MELVNSFNFVKVEQKNKVIAKSMLKEEIKEAFNDIKLHQAGRKKLQSAKDFLNEL